MGRLKAARPLLQQASAGGPAPLRRASARRRHYSSKWDKASKTFLQKHPLCLGCQAVGLRRRATVTDHVEPHKGDQALFWSRDNWQPSCGWHHNVVKQRLELMFQRGAIKPEDLSLDSKAAIDLTRQLATEGQGPDT